MKKILLAVIGLIVLLGVGMGGYAYSLASAFDESMAKVYDVPPLDHIEASKDPAAIERGKHLSESLGGCTLADCHGSDFSGGRTIEMGPVGTMTGPNITRVVQVYTDGEMARLLRHGITKSGKSVRFMPSHEFGWWPDSDIAALNGYLRTVEPVDKANGPMEFGLLAKILDRRGDLHIDIARKLEADPVKIGPPPAPTEEYGEYVALLCTGCHGANFGGGPIPGAPPDMAVPLNLTPHETGLGKDYSYEQFEKLIADGTMKNGKKADEFMPIEALQNMNETERKALYAYLRSVEPLPMGSR